MALTFSVVLAVAALAVAIRDVRRRPPSVPG
jgi:hypothetical protein